MKRAFLTLLFLLPLLLFGQEEEAPKPVTVEIEKKNGEVLTGRLLGVSKDSVSFVDDHNREYKIAKKDIRNIDYSEKRFKQFRWPGSPNTIRYLLSSTAYPLRKGEVVLGSTYILLTTVNVGLSNRVTLATGGDLFGGSTYFINSKINIIRKPKYMFSTQVNYYRLPSDFLETSSGDDVRNMGMLTAAGTWGNENNHITAGVGYMYTREFGTLPPVVTVSGTLRVLKRFGLVTENWFFFVNERIDFPVLISLGVRYIGNRSTLDLAYYSSDKSLFAEGLPYVAYSIRLGKRRN
jgi:hypothetical protein